MASFTGRISGRKPQRLLLLLLFHQRSGAVLGWRSGMSPHVDMARQAEVGGGPVILELPLEKIRRPLMWTRANDPSKIQELMDSIQVISLQVAIDMLEVDGVYCGLFPDTYSLFFLLICIEASWHLATVKVDDLLYFVVPQASPAVISTKLIGASASLPSIAKFVREYKRP